MILLTGGYLVWSLGGYLVWPGGCTWSGPGVYLVWSWRGVCQVPPPGPDPPRPGTFPQTRHTPLGPGTPPRPDTPRRPDQTPPWDQVHPPRPDTPPGTRSPLDQTPPPTGTRFTPPLEQQTPEYSLQAAGTHPTGMHSCCNWFHLTVKSSGCNKMRTGWERLIWSHSSARFLLQIKQKFELT